MGEQPLPLTFLFMGVLKSSAFILTCFRIVSGNWWTLRNYIQWNTCKRAEQRVELSAFCEADVLATFSVLDQIKKLH